MFRKHAPVVFLLSALAFSLAGQQPKLTNPVLRNIQHKISIVGGVEITASDKAINIAIPRARFPQVHFVEAKQFFTQNKDRSKTPSGLYILDANFLPPQLPEILSRAHLTLKPDGSLVNAQGGKVAMVLWHKLIAVNAQRAAAQEDPAQKWSLFPGVHAASPYPLSYVSAWGSWSADNGFCRSLTADTGADSWGPVQNGARPHTRIQFIETRAWASGASTVDHQCSNCDTLTSQSEASFGCFWPAYGGGTYSYADLKDGSFSWSWQYYGD